MEAWQIMLILGTVTALINYYRLKLEDTGEKPKLQTILLWITLIMGICSLPVIIVFLGLNMLYSNRLSDQYEKKILSLEAQIIDLKAKIRESRYSESNRYVYHPAEQQKYIYSDSRSDAPETLRAKERTDENVRLSCDLKNQGAEIQPQRQAQKVVIKKERPPLTVDEIMQGICSHLWYQSSSFLKTACIPQTACNHTFFWAVLYYSVFDILEKNNANEQVLLEFSHSCPKRLNIPSYDLEQLATVKRLRDATLKSLFEVNPNPALAYGISQILEMSLVIRFPDGDEPEDARPTPPDIAYLMSTIADVMQFTCEMLKKVPAPRPTGISFLDYRDSTLIVIFKNGAEYRNHGVPKSVYEAFNAAESKEEYYNNHIKNKYPRW